MSNAVLVQAIKIINSADLDAALPQNLLRGLRRADDFIRLTVAAGSALISSLPTESSLPEKTGIYVGTTTGPLETNFRFLDTLLDDGEGQGSPTLFSHSVHNSAAGYLARMFEIRGPALTLTTYGWPFLAALAEARAALATGQLQAALVIGVEEETPVLVEARGRLTATAKEKTGDDQTCHKGAVGWLLTADNGIGGDGAPRLHGIELDEQMVDPVEYLARTEVVSSSLSAEIDEYGGAEALAAPVNLSNASLAAREMNVASLEWRLESSFGRALVTVGF